MSRQQTLHARLSIPLSNLADFQTCLGDANISRAEVCRHAAYLWVLSIMKLLLQ